MHHFAVWLAASSASDAIRKLSWIIPAVQTVHILCISILLSSVAMLDLRLMQLIQHPQSIIGMARRFLPAMWAALVLLAVSGTILIIGEPGRELLNWTFWVKMSGVCLAAATTAAFQLALRGDQAFWERSPVRRGWARVAAIVSLLLWVGVAVAGRWIAYVTTDN